MGVVVVEVVVVDVVVVEVFVVTVEFDFYFINV